MAGVVMNDLSGKPRSVPMVGKGTPVPVIQNRTSTAQQNALNASGRAGGARLHVII